MKEKPISFYLTLAAAGAMLLSVLLAGTCRGQCEGGKCESGQCFTAPGGQYDVLGGQPVLNPNWRPRNAAEALNAGQVIQQSDDIATLPDMTSQLDASPDKAICMVATFDQQIGKWRVGSGTLIASHPTENQALVLTCAHGSSQSDGKNYCLFGDGSRPRNAYKGRVLEFDAKDDAMVLVISKPPGITPIALSNIEVRNGQKVWTVGYRYDRGGAFSSGVGKVVPPDGNPNSRWTGGAFSSDAEASQGQSGGPILNEYKHVCGVISGGDPRGRTIGTSVFHLRTRFPLLRSWLTGLPPGPTLVQRTRTPQGNTVTRRPMVPMLPANPQTRVPPMPEDQSPPPLPIPTDPATPPDAGPPTVEQPTPAPVTELALRLDALEKSAASRDDLARFKGEILEAIAKIPPSQQGPPGQPGPPGAAYQLTDADRTKITAAVRASLVDSDGVARSLPPIHVKLVDQATKKEKVVPVYLGEGFQYNLFPESSK